MADKPSDDRAAFGVFPQLQRNRSRQDREAAKNVPVDLARGFVAGVAGAPGDIESFLRIPYDYLRAPTMSELVTGDKTSKTYLSTSEDIEKRLPFRSETPVSKAASGLGTLAGGFYYGPGSPLKVIGALPGAVRHGAEEFAKASVAGVPYVVKPKGGVNISNNPDTMMLELGNKAPMKASEALGRIEGRPLKITQADRTKVGGGYLGGPGFSGLQLTEPEYRAAEAAWAVQNAGTAKTILGGEGDNAVYAAMLGTPTQHQSNQMVFDKLLGDFKKAAKRGELTPELRDLINMRLAAAVDKKGNPVFPADVDIMDKKFRDIADTFSRRSIAGHLMGGVQVGGKKGQIIDYDKIIRSTTDPDLLDQPTGALGNRLFTLSGGIVQRPDLHPAFPTILQGEDLGVMFTPVERDIVMKDFVEKTMREKGRKPGYMDYTRGNPPTQLITEDILTELQKLGKKKGGAVHKAAGGEVSGDDLILEERPL